MKNRKLFMIIQKMEEELKSVFQMCEPNEDGLISLQKLQELFEKFDHKDQVRNLICNGNIEPEIGPKIELK